MRVAIAGVPKAGKTTLAEQLDGLKLATDALIHDHDWSGASQAASEWLDLRCADLVLEGVAVPRALRKWLARNSEGKPVDRVVWLGSPREELTPGQATMAKGCATVWREILPELKARGVEIEER